MGNAKQPTFLGVKLHKMKKRKTFRFSSFFVGVRWARLELAQDYSHYPLKVACLPFHHHRFVLGLQRYEHFFNFQIFLQKFYIFLKIFFEAPFSASLRLAHMRIYDMS